MHYHSLALPYGQRVDREPPGNCAEEDFTWTLALEETRVCLASGQVSGWCQPSERRADMRSRTHASEARMCSAPVHLPRDVHPLLHIDTHTLNSFGFIWHLIDTQTQQVYNLKHTLRLSSERRHQVCACWIHRRHQLEDLFKHKVTISELLHVCHYQPRQ